MDISQYMFANNVFFIHTEKMETQTTSSSPLFGVSLLSRLLQLVDVDSISRVHVKCDITIITPLMKLTNMYVYTAADQTHDFCEGWLATPIMRCLIKFIALFLLLV